MKTLNQQFRIFAKNWKLGLLVLFAVVIFLLTPVLVSGHYGGNTWWFILAGLLLSSVSLGFFVAETQKELMSRGIGFLLPNLDRAVISSQIVTMTVLAGAIFLLVFFLPALAPVTMGSFLHSLSFVFLALLVFTFTLLVNFLFKYSAYLAMFGMFPYFFYIKFGMNAEVQSYHHWLGNSGFLLVGSLLFVVINVVVLKALNLPRRLSEKPFLSTLQMFKPAKVQDFKNQLTTYNQPKDQSQRPLKHAMDLCLEKSSLARFAGNESKAVFWDTIHLALTTGIPRGFLGAWNYVFFIVPFVLVIGYADSMTRCDSGLDGWYSSFPFMFATLPIVAFHYLRISPLGLPRSRKATEKAGYITIGWMVLATAALSVFIFGVLHILAAVMPELETPTRLWSYHPSTRLHTPFMPLIIMPVILVIYLLWPKKSAQFILGAAGMQVFIIFNGLMSEGEHSWPAMVVLVLSVAAWLSLPGLWRRRMRPD